jgi:hypothetical protein
MAAILAHKLLIEASTYSWVWDVVMGKLKAPDPALLIVVL